MGPDAGFKYQALYHLESGVVLSSQDVTFHEVPLNSIVMIDFVFKHYTYRLSKDVLGPTFKEFIHFRSATSTTVIFGEFREPIMYNTWYLGWTDHVNEYLDEYAAKTGVHLGRTIIPRNFELTPTHFHKDAVRIIP